MTLLLLLLLLFNKLCIIIKTTSYKNLYENKVVDPSEEGFCAKFELDVTSTFAKKNCQKRFPGFSQYFRFFAFLTYKMTSKFKFDLIRPT